MYLLLLQPHPPPPPCVYSLKEAMPASVKTSYTQVDLVGHSAGGWLARAFTADPAYFPQQQQQQAEGPAASGTSSSTDGNSVGSSTQLSAAMPSLPPLTLTLPLPDTARSPQVSHAHAFCAHHCAHSCRLRCPLCPPHTHSAPARHSVCATGVACITVACGCMFVCTV